MALPPDDPKWKAEQRGEGADASVFSEDEDPAAGASAPPAAASSPLSAEEQRAALELEQEEQELKHRLEEIKLLEEEQRLRAELSVIEAQLKAQEDEPETKVRQEGLSAEQKERLERHAAASAAAVGEPEMSDNFIPPPPPPPPSPPNSPAPIQPSPKLSVETPSPTPNPAVSVEGPASDLTFSGKQEPRPISAKGRGGNPEGPEVGTKGKDDQPEDRQEPKIGEEMNWRAWAQALFAGFRIVVMNNIVGPVAKPILGALQAVNGAVTFGMGKLSGNEKLQKSGLDDMQQGRQAIASTAEGGWEAIKRGAKGIRDMAYALPVLGPLTEAVVHSRKPKPESLKSVPDDPLRSPETEALLGSRESAEEAKRLREVDDAAFELSRSGTELVPNPRSKRRPDEITPKHNYDVAASEPLASAAKVPAVSPGTGSASTPPVEPESKIGHDHPNTHGRRRR